MLAWLIWGSLQDPQTLWAPGSLSVYHTDIPSCRGCHQAFRGVTRERCLRCHTEQRFGATKREDVGGFHLNLIQKQRRCLDCHTEHRGVLAPITIGQEGNPHGQFVFLATGTHSCTECHAFGSPMGGPPILLDNEVVRDLFREGNGRHKAGAFRQCLQCHAGGELDIETD